MREDDFEVSGRGRGKTAVVFMMGALVGAGAALLMAPASGSKSRKMLSRKLREWGDTAHDGLNHMRDEVTRHVDELKPRVDAAVEAGRKVARPRHY